MVTISRLENYFVLTNQKISYILEILPDGTPAHVYFGKCLPHIDLQQLQYICRREGKSAGTIKVYKGSSFSLADQMLEYPVYGTTSFQSPALMISVNQSPLYLNLSLQDYEIHAACHNGQPEAMPHCRFDEQAKTLVLHLMDETWKIGVDLLYTLTDDSAMVIRQTKVTNHGEQSIQIDKAASGALNVGGSDWDLVHFEGSWARERQQVRQHLVQGQVDVQSLYGSSSHQSNPYTVLVRAGAREDQEDAYGVNLVYSSSFLNEAMVNEFNTTRLISGIHPLTFAWTLRPGQTFTTPEMMMGYSDQGMDGLSRVFSRFIRDFILNPRFAYRHRPIVLNSWEAVYFELNEDNLYSLAQKAARTGIECFVVDDGWFGKRDTDTTSLGDWFVDESKFPHGLDAFASKVRELGMEFGLWFEPEMINEESELYRQHPDWVLRPPKGRISYGRSQLVLDFANPQVVEAVYQMMKPIIEKTGLSYLKWDMNRDITEAWSSYLDRHGISQMELFHRYILGVYSLYEKIQRDFPEVLIEGCAGGGGRFDPGILYYSSQIWVSDNTDAFDRLKIQYATSMGYPLSCLSNHIAEIPSHQTGRLIGTKFRKDVAFFGILGYEINLERKQDLDEEQIRSQIEAYRQMEPAILHGDLYHLRSPFHSNQPAWAIADKNDLYVGVYRILSDLQSIPTPSLRLPFLQSEENHLPDEWICKEQRLTSALLAQMGLRLPSSNNGTNQKSAQMVGDFQSCLIHLKAAS